MEPDSGSPPPLRVLVIDDERNIRTTLVVCLEGFGCKAREAATAEAALEALRFEPFDLAFLDLRLGQANGMDLLTRLLAERPGLDVVIITAYATFETAVEAVKRGARDYLPKPFTPAQIRHVVDRAMNRRAVESRVLDLQSRLEEAVPDTDLETASPRMQAALEVLSKAAVHEVSLLLRGESGTGKGVLARALHALSPRRDRPFVVVNCPTLSEELLASELFGHARGAFTGRCAIRPGGWRRRRVARSSSTRSPRSRPRSSRSCSVFSRRSGSSGWGENQTRVADVRIVAATNRDLEAEVKAGRFREDLLYRLNVVEVAVPAAARAAGRRAAPGPPVRGLLLPPGGTSGTRAFTGG